MVLFAQVGNRPISALPRGDGSRVVPGATPVFSIGYPQGYGFTVDQGIVKSFEGPRQAHLWLTSMTFKEGQSGSPILLSDGTVVAVAKGDDLDARSIGLVLPARPWVPEDFWQGVGGTRRPRVAIVGSTLDYLEYRLYPFVMTSALLLEGKLRSEFVTMPIHVNYGWPADGYFEGEERRPQAIVIHASAFHADGLANEAVDKFQAVVSSWLREMPEVKIVVFTRVPERTSAPGLCGRWRRQVAFLTAKANRDRLVFYPLRRSEADFEGAAGTEIRRIVRCQLGLDGAKGCAALLQAIEERAARMVAEVRCR
jgi:hypothetical protein